MHILPAGIRRRWKARQERKRRRLEDPRYNPMLAQVLWYEERYRQEQRDQAAHDERNRQIMKEGY